MVVGDTCVSEAGMVATVSRDKRFRICGGAHGFCDAANWSSNIGLAYS